MPTSLSWTESHRDDIDILMLSMYLGEMGLAILYIDLRMPGNSGTSCRMQYVAFRNERDFASLYNESPS